MKKIIYHRVLTFDLFAEETDNTKTSMFFVADGFDYEEIYNFGVEFAKTYVCQQKI